MPRHFPQAWTLWLSTILVPLLLVGEVQNPHWHSRLFQVNQCPSSHHPIDAVGAIWFHFPFASRCPWTLTSARISECRGRSPISSKTIRQHGGDDSSEFGLCSDTYSPPIHRLLSLRLTQTSSGSQEVKAKNALIVNVCNPHLLHYFSAANLHQQLALSMNGYSPVTVRRYELAGCRISSLGSRNLDEQ